jgi:hypothetical protein
MVQGDTGQRWCRDTGQKLCRVIQARNGAAGDIGQGI